LFESPNEFRIGHGISLPRRGDVGWPLPSASPPRDSGTPCPAGAMQ
jgi:hypothetical protein